MLASPVKADCQSEFNNKNYIEAFGICQNESEESADAQFIMAQIYAKGLGVGRDLTQAINYLSQAAQAEHTQAMFNLAVAFELGKGVEKNLVVSHEWQLKSAHKGWLKAQRKVAKMYETGQGVRPDAEQAYIWYKKAAEQGDADSQLELGAVLLQGINLPGKTVQKDIDKGLYWIKESAKQNNAEAQFAIATLIIDKAPEEAMSFYLKAAENGNKFAMHNLASIYLKGEIVPQDVVNSKHFAVMAIAKGQKSSQSILDHIVQLENLNKNGSKKENTKEVEKTPQLASSEQTSPAINEQNITENKGETEAETTVKTQVENEFITSLRNANYVLQLASMAKKTSVNGFIKKYNLMNKVHVLFIPNTKRYLILSEPKEYLTQARELQKQYNELLNSSAWLRKTPAVLALLH